MTREQYESLPLAELKGIAKTRGMKGTSTLKKSDLITRMLEKDEEVSRQEQIAQTEKFQKERQERYEQRQEQREQRERAERTERTERPTRYERTGAGRIATTAMNDMRERSALMSVRNGMSATNSAPTSAPPMTAAQRHSPRPRFSPSRSSPPIWIAAR